MAATTTSTGGQAQASAAAHAAPHGAQRGAVATLVLANTLWASTYVAGKVALRDLSPVELNAARFTIAALLLAPVLIRHHREIPRDRATLLTLARLILLGWVLNKLFEYVGLALSTASDVALLISTESIFFAVISWIFLRERVTRAGVWALALGLAGAYLIVERGLAPSLDGPGGGARILGDLLVVLSLLFEAGYSAGGKAALAQLPPLLFLAITITGSLVIWIPAGLIAVVRAGPPHLAPAGWLSLLYMAAISGVAGYWLWFRALRTIDGSAAAPTLFIQPLLGAALGIWLLHDAISWATLAGAALILLSILLVVRAQRRPSPASPASSTSAVISESIP
jgi:drug/metabolite transporter (DMT)-like permease